MEVINNLLTAILGIISSILPVFQLPKEFIEQLDKALVLVITLIEGASWILPMDVMLICFTTMLVVDNWAILVRIAQWIIELIRG